MIHIRRSKHSQPTTQPKFNQSSQAQRTGVVIPTETTIRETSRWNGSPTMSIDHPDKHLNRYHTLCSVLTSMESYINEHPNRMALKESVSNLISRGQLLQTQGPQLNMTSTPSPIYIPLTPDSIDTNRDSSAPTTPPTTLNPPDYLKPPSSRMTSIDIDYLFARGALSPPDTYLRNALLESFFNYVYPHTPLVDIHELLTIIHEGTGHTGQMSLLLFQAVMFAGSAFVNIELLQNAGYYDRKAARNVFFQKVRV